MLDDIQNEDGTFTGSLSSGNPDLEPYRSMNVDASFEYYMKGGLISVAPFYKREQDDLSFFGQSDRVGNVAVLYQKYRIEAQVSASYTSATLGSLGLNLDSDNYADSYLPVDAKASYAISLRLESLKAGIGD